MKIKSYKLQKVEVAETEMFIPQKPYYAFETHVRRSIRIIPKWTTWQKEQSNKEEEIYELEVTCVYLSFKCKVEKVSIGISQVERIVNDTNSNSTEKGIVEGLLNDYFNLRTKEQFDADLLIAINQINN